jgi:hypothetical protein
VTTDACREVETRRRHAEIAGDVLVLTLVRLSLCMTEPQRGGARHGPPPPEVDKRAASYRTTNVNGKTQSVGGISTGACWPSNQPPDRSFIVRVELW